MDLIGNRRKRTHKTVVSNSLKDLYPHNLQLYSLPPTNEIQLLEFEELALERLQLLRIIEQTTQKGLQIYSDAWRESIVSELHRNQLKKYLKLVTLDHSDDPRCLEARRADHISHFILRLAYCRTEVLRRWFLSRELEWFKFRFLQLSAESIGDFLKLNNLTYTPISDEEKRKYYDELCSSTAKAYVIDGLNFYKVKFLEVPSLVKSRRVFVSKGYAYIPHFELITCILGSFRSSLNEALVYASRRIPSMDDERINLLINNLHNVYVGKDYAQNSSSGNISLSGLDFYAKNHFPLCMKHIYGVLKTTHHLKHACRLQLGLFLKGIGLTYEDAMNFWRDEFTKKIDSGKFEKDYAYNIKHMYGLVGQRTSYSPYSCLKIINSSVGPGEQQGCPYKHWDPVYLRSKLNEVGISSEGKYLSFNLANNFERMLLGVEDIVDAATKGHFQIACGKYFQYTHGQENKNGINHPNQYFEDSVECKKESKDASRSTPKAIKKQKAVDTSVKVNDINWDEDM